MSLFIENLKEKNDFYYEKGASLDDIKRAEEALGLVFSEDYKKCLQLYGSISYGGHELTGFSEDESLDVINVTLNNLKKNNNIKIPLYVIEETHMDGIVIWQAPTGEIYQTGYKGVPEKIYESLEEYMATF